MKTGLVFAIFVMAAFAAVQGEENESPHTHTLHKRQTFTLPKPNIPKIPSIARCDQKECNAKCEREGHFGGLCNLRGCWCTG